MTVIQFCHLPDNQQKEIARFLNWKLIGFKSKLLVKLIKKGEINV
jgi:hypothetical protein